MTPLDALKFALSEVGCGEGDMCPHWVMWHKVARDAIAAAARQSGDVKQAPGEAPQSGHDSGIAQTQSQSID